MLQPREFLKKRLNELNTILDDPLDNDFSAVSHRIETMEDFNSVIMNEYKSGKKIVYRGERINDPTRHLVPTMLRNPNKLLEDNDIGLVHIDSKHVLDFYSSKGQFVDLFSKTMGKVDEDHLYDICAFAQHYYHNSPLIDFSKDIYPALSFALKNRTSYDEDIVLYTLEVKKDEQYTNDKKVANKWLKNINIYVSSFEEANIRRAIKDLIENKTFIIPDDLRRDIENFNTIPVPSAKIIDVPTNTRMQFQQGVFLLLTDFSMLDAGYLTKSIRDDFHIKKYVISKNICKDLLDMIKKEAPWYNYEYLLNEEAAFKKSIG